MPNEDLLTQSTSDFMSRIRPRSNMGQMYVGPDVMEQLPQGQTAVSPGFSGPIPVPGRDVFDMLNAASVKSQAIAQRKAVDAEQERLRSEWFLRQTAGQLRQFQAAAKAKNDFDKQALSREASALIIQGQDPLTAIKSSGLVKYMTPAELIRFQPKPLTPPKKMMAAPEVVSLEGKKYSQQVDPNTGRVFRQSIGEVGGVSERERFDNQQRNQQRRNVQVQLDAIDGEIASNAENLPLPGEFEIVSKDPKRTRLASEYKDAIAADVRLKLKRSEIEKQLNAFDVSIVGPKAGSESTTDNPRRITRKEERDNLPPGTDYIWTDGKVYTRQ